MRDIEEAHFEKARADAEKYGRKNNVLNTSNRKKGKLATIARLSALWLPLAPRIILIGSRISEQDATALNISTENLQCDSIRNFLLTGELRNSFIISIWFKVFGTATELPSAEDLFQSTSNYDTAKWDWSLAAKFNVFLVPNYFEILKHTSAGKGGLHNFCYKYGGKYVLDSLVRLIDSYFSGDVLPADINEGLCLPTSK